jgi:hypothetical protein
MAVFRGVKTPPGSPIVYPRAFYEVIFDHIDYSDRLLVASKEARVQKRS